MDVMNKIVHYARQGWRHIFLSKLELELSYWKDTFKSENGQFENGFYKKMMLAMAEENNDTFLKGKVVGDFGCGPRGSLAWADAASLRIGIDVIANRYLQCFPAELQKHKMIYVTSSEHSIPIPDATLDILFTVNALDHVTNLSDICSELRRIVKPGGLIIGSFNLNHPPTKAEPQRITEDVIKTLLFRDYEILSWRMSAPDTADKNKSLYHPLLTNQLIEPGGKPAFLWAKVRKT